VGRLESELLRRRRELHRFGCFLAAVGHVLLKIGAKLLIEAANCILLFKLLNAV
jgi:hypothetical protein